MDKPGRLSPRWLAVAIAVLAFVVYANSLSSEFAFDDTGVVAENTALHDIGNLGRLVVSPYWPGLPRAEALYRPVTTASFAIDWQLWQGSPTGFHAVNVFMHVGVTLLLFALLLRLGAPVVAAAVGAAIFAVHPVHTEAVANVVGRAEMLAAGFVLIACLVFLQTRLRPALRIAVIALCYFLALGSKESAVVLPGLLVLLAWLGPESETRLTDVVRRDWMMFAVLSLVLVAYLGLRYSVLGVFGGALPAAFMRDASRADHVASAIRVWPEYLRLLVFPKNLSSDYSPAVIMPTTWGDPRVWITLPIGMMLLGVAVAFRRRWGWGALAILWFALAILPVSNLLFPIGVLLAERTLYLPSIALAFAIPALVPWYRGLRVPEQRVLAGIACVVVLLGALRTWTRNPAWGSTEAVFATLGRERPDSYRGMWYNADMEVQRGNVARGLALYQRAFELVPRNQQLGSTYAYELLRHGRPADAERVVRSVFNPGFLSNHAVLIESLIRLGRFDEAEKEIAVVTRFAPNSPVVQALRTFLAERRSALGAGPNAFERVAPERDERR